MPHDDLIQRIRRRAWDPARRHDLVYVPLDWLKREYGENIRSRIHHTQQTLREGGSTMRLNFDDPTPDHLINAALEAGASEAVKYFSDVPHAPPYPPISETDLRACEQRIGQELPELLRRVYTEVGNGGFGPSYDLLSLPSGGHRAYEAGPDALEEYEKRPEVSSVLGFPLVAAGCSMYWYVSLTLPGNPVCLWDGDAWDFPDVQSPKVGIVAICSSLAEWFDRWVDGRNLETSHPERQDQQERDGIVSGRNLETSHSGDDSWGIPENDPWLAATEWEYGLERDLTDGA
ncbi:SMI1/KNR4 family protein [Nonomuraea recticatena]|uniref:Knr4/Smi1-like domain-containing protein n=1 Tax=Nonomuraea recticatena TaxID=46178 RepID=A0ABN3SD40_9ACTN